MPAKPGTRRRAPGPQGNPRGALRSQLGAPWRRSRRRRCQRTPARSASLHPRIFHQNEFFNKKKSREQGEASIVLNVYWCYLGPMLCALGRFLGALLGLQDGSGDVRRAGFASSRLEKRFLMTPYASAIASRGGASQRER